MAHYLNFIHRKIGKKLFNEITQAYNTIEPDEEVHIYINSKGGEISYALSIVDILRKEAHRTKVYFTDQMGSCAILILQESLILNIGTVIFPLSLNMHKARVAVEIMSLKIFPSSFEKMVSQEIHETNSLMESQPFYSALDEEQRSIYDSGADVYLTSSGTKTYLNRLTKIINIIHKKSK